MGVHTTAKEFCLNVASFVPFGHIHRWQKVSGFLRTPEATVRNLEPGKGYEFRVMAENSYGVSEPLMTSETIRPKHPFSKRSFST